MIASARIGLYLENRVFRGNFAILILILFTEEQLDALLPLFICYGDLGCLGLSYFLYSLTACKKEATEGD